MTKFVSSVTVTGRQLADFSPAMNQLAVKVYGTGLFYTMRIGSTVACSDYPAGNTDIETNLAPFAVTFCMKSHGPF